MGFDHLIQKKADSPIGRIPKELSKEREQDIVMPFDGVAVLFKRDKFEICGNVQYIRCCHVRFDEITFFLRKC